MTIPATATPNPIIPPNARVPFVDNKGNLTTTSLQLLQRFFTAINGLAPTFACDATAASNVYTLTPIGVSPSLPGYFDYWSFAFVAPATSTGLVTATVVPNTGALPTIPVYKTNGSAQATTGDITSGLFYVLYYVDTLNSGNGGLVLK